MKKVKIAIFFFLLLSLQNSMAAGADVGGGAGSFSITAFGGYHSTRLLNTDGTYASYGGPGYGGQLGVQIIGAEDTGLALFAQYVGGQGSGTSSNQTESLLLSEVFGGFQAYLFNSFFLGAGYGVNNLTQKNNGASVAFNSKVLGVGFGFNFIDFGSFDLSFQTWYKAGSIPKAGDLSSNSGVDSIEALLGFRLSLESKQKY